jgi:hypothetical protein
MYMDENAVKEKVQKVYFEPRAPEELIQKVVLRAKAVTMGLEARKQLETAPAERVGELASRALIGQLATLTELPKNTQPEQLAQQLQQEPAFLAALRIWGRSSPKMLIAISEFELESAELMRCAMG